MKKFSFFILFLFIVVSLSFSQDIIFKSNGEEIKCKVLEVTAQSIRYKNYNNQKGPDYSVLKKEVDKIVFENGDEDIFQNLDTLFKVTERPQGSISELHYENGFWGLTILQGTRKLSSQEVRQVYKNDPEALRLFSNGKALNTIGSIIGIPCAFVFGYQLGTLLGGGETNSTVLAVGGAGVVVGIVMGVAGDSSIKKSVHIYNSNLKKDMSVNFKIGLTKNGVGLCLNF